MRVFLVRPASHNKKVLRKRERGISLVEVLLAFFVTVVGLLPIVSILTLAPAVNNQAQAQAVAYQVAQRQMELIRARSHASRPVTAETAFTPDPAALAALRLTAGQNAEVQLQGFFSIDSTTSSTLRQVNVRVRWRTQAVKARAKDAQGQSRRPWSEVRLSTLFASEPGV